MKIKVSEIDEEGLSLDLSEKIPSDALFKTEDPVSAHLEFFRQDGEVRIEGDINGTVMLQCSRCLEGINRDLRLKLNLVFLPSSETVREETHELERGETNTGFYSDDLIDLSDVVKEQLLLSLPMKPLCSHSCRGLCSVCGLNLNYESCDCDGEAVDPRFEKLGKLFT